jgi:D-3-phosphoglycerate dehydrogenase / 2-oxoglutarate reductase
MNKQYSYPKQNIKVLLLENIHKNATTIFGIEGYDMQEIKGALTEEELISKIQDVHILGIRSKTQITEKILAHAGKLLCIGTYCIGTNQIDLSKSAQQGVVVFNAPYSNTRSVVELALGEMLVLIRNVYTKSNLLHQGIWDKSANSSFEVRGKTLGIVGYGNIGTQLSVLAEALGMYVCYYDIVDKLALGNAKKCNSLTELLQQADVVSLHVDGRSDNKHLIGDKEFKLMKTGVIFLNLSRGHVVDVDALANAVKSGKVAGTGVDVYPYEPVNNEEVFESPLRQLPNTILTPHVGGSTEEAQANIGDFVSHKIINFINKGDTYGAVNFPEVQLPSFEGAHRMLHAHKNVPGILAQINTIFAKYEANIQAQYLKTMDDIGYVITDIATNYNPAMVEALKQIENTVRLRILY